MAATSNSLPGRRENRRAAAVLQPELQAGHQRDAEISTTQLRPGGPKN